MAAFLRERRIPWRVRALFAEKGFVLNVCRQLRRPEHIGNYIQRKIYLASNQLVKKSKFGGQLFPPLLSLTWWGASKPQDTGTPQSKEMSELELDIKTADELFDETRTQEVYDLLLKHRDLQNAEIEWRLARACRVLAEECDDADAKKRLTYEALEHAKLALDLDDKNYASHKWYAIGLSIVGDYEGNKAKLENSKIMKDHFERAIELNPTDPTSRYLLGLWCFTFADMNWFTKNVAAALFATPPSSSYEEALSHFQEAEKLEPNFFSKNHLMLGTTLFKQKKREEAKVWLSKAVNENPLKTKDDEKAKEEAEELLKRL
ncbi:unnamed protein product [Pocillopora meandrina]|uniref:Regulator of microtubule dynamics protein 1 n=1 Tax=Pocillopora meandrina TaxID=46732 RepID=A0AAU9X5D7_9CNID|nr:unnamed protein product [Pocillopora meandrina]